MQGTFISPYMLASLCFKEWISYLEKNQAVILCFEKWAASGSLAMGTILVFALILGATDLVRWCSYIKKYPWVGKPAGMELYPATPCLYVCLKIFLQERALLLSSWAYARTTFFLLPFLSILNHWKTYSMDVLSQRQFRMRLIG